MQVTQPRGERGSLKWMQRAVGEVWPALDRPIIARMPEPCSISWLSPREEDRFAEYRDASFLRLVGCDDLAEALADYWPNRGPQWDALGMTSTGQVLLVEATAHVAEMCSPGSGAERSSRAKIAERLDALAEKLGASSRRASWVDVFYQLANRMAHLDFLRSHGRDAYLVLVNFLGDREMGGPSAVETWDAAYSVALHAMGLPRRHGLSPFMIHVSPDVGGMI